MKEKTKQNPLLIVIGAILTVAVLGLVALNVIILWNNQKISQFVDDERIRQAEELNNKNDYKEDGYLVGELYEIRSTKKLSDAYKSGDMSGLTDEEKQTIEMAKAVLEEVTTEGMSKYDREIAIVDWICANVKIGGSTMVRPGESMVEAVSTPYGVLKGHNAVCVGFATTFRLLMQMMDIDCHVVHNEYHSWDLVQLDDGEWYHVDLYMENEAHNYRNVNMSDSRCETGHEWMGRNFLPVAKGIEYTVASQEAKTIKELKNIPSLLFERAQGNADSFALYYKLTNGFTDQDLNTAELLANMLEYAFEACEEEGFSTKSFESAWEGNEENGYILCLYVEDCSGSSDEPDVPDEPSENYEALIEAIDEAFGTNLAGGSYFPEYSDEYGYKIDTVDGFIYYISEDGGTLTILPEDPENGEMEVITDLEQIEEILSQLYQLDYEGDILVPGTSVWES